MNKFEVKWSMGRKTQYETEQTLEKFCEYMFGHPSRLPDGVTVTEVKEDAPQVGKVEKGDLGEHQDRDGGGKAAGAISGDSPVKSGEIKAQAKAEQPKKVASAAKGSK